MTAKPEFIAKSELARYVDKDEYMKGGRVTSGAFLPNPGDDYLSVNSLEIESINDIANYFSKVFGESTVKICTRKVSEYNNSTSGTAIHIIYDRRQKKWIFQVNSLPKEAFEHRPRYTPPPKSISHCGVEFINSSVEYSVLKQISRRLGGKKPHIHRIKTS
ncbi:MAG: hypothetical protein HQ517_04820 [SAR324 cluster bacterium]|nr:hypothetical protein [SAR324 cluster bacterium]